MPPPAPPTELVPSERAVVLLSCALSALGSGLLVATHALWPDLRSRARRLLLFLSLADLLSAASYFYGVLQDFAGPSWDCVLQGALSTFANTSSFFWTVAIALYLYLSIVRAAREPRTGRLLWAFHVVSWGVPLAITVAAVALKKIGYDASDVSVGWCWIDLDAEDRVLWMLLTGKLWEMLAYVTLPVLYLLIRKHINRAGIGNTFQGGANCIMFVLCTHAVRTRLFSVCCRCCPSQPSAQSPAGPPKPPAPSKTGESQGSRHTPDELPVT
ncbi:G-protein coupled receptor 157 isoform X2 [Acinonyx jubatus]|uniref:G-protein coupled receptor 157 isoform X2 n=1 Tax=Acinonyx jubatus TaxID=32536 RepID=A0ABM3NTB6_ACIJB|nr:G-protein coupled receptor 157 isoform X2 [Felis catus]XP_053062673.1 G-protein coupled receptor 157 isoform X2 [Acinonyx jubatus]